MSSSSGSTRFIDRGRPDAAVTVWETERLGVGHEFELEFDGDERAIVLINHDSKRGVSLQPGGRQESQKLFTLTGKLAPATGYHS